MRILIIEDEHLAQHELIRILNKNYPDYTISGVLDSVDKSIEWLNNNEADLIFMDIQLADGISFDIFNYVELDTPIIFTTAYDQYAIKAFDVNGVGYLLKPVMEQDLIKAVSRVVQRQSNIDEEGKIALLLKQFQQPKQYKHRIGIKVGEMFSFIDIADVAYFYVEDRVTFVKTKSGKRHIIDYTLDGLLPLLDPKTFFQITRGCIASISAVKSVSKYFNSRLKVTLEPNLDVELLVSRIRVADFLRWLDGM